MKLGIVGHGFVGKAVDFAFTHPSMEKTIVDPVYNTDISILSKTPHDVVFVCVPTPQQNTHFDVDVSSVRQVLSDLYDRNYKGIVVIKSTITPDHLTTMKKDFKLKLVYNPEFLTEANSLQDFINPNMQVLGGKWRDCEAVEKAYIRHSSVKTVPTFKTDLITASLIKYTINSWLAVKVTFFNELFELFEKSGAAPQWSQFTDMITRDPRMGETHMQVPGPDGKFGYGGHCFPKDTKAFLYYSKLYKKKLTILEHAIQLNEKHREKS